MRPVPARAPVLPARLLFALRSAVPRRGAPTAVLVAVLLALAATVVAGTAPAAAQDDGAQEDGAQDAAGAQIDVVEVDGTIDGTIARYMQERIAAAQDDGSALVVISMASPGGLGGHVEDLIAAVDASAVPVVVWAGPPGSALSGAGMAVAQAAHVLAVSPGTVLGPTVPFDLEDDAGPAGSPAPDVAVAERRGRNAAAAQELADGGALVIADGDQVDLTQVDPPHGTTADELRAVGPAELVESGAVDLVAASLPEVLADLDGREVLIGPDAAPQVLAADTTTASLRFHSLGLVRQVLHTVATPDLAYLLLVAGVLCIVFEAFQPGFGVAGVTGLVMAALGTAGLAALPVSWLAFAVLLAALAIMAVDLAVAGFGWATLAGTLGMLAGSWFLVPGPDLLRVSTWVVLAVVAFNVVFFVVIMTNVLRTQGNQATAGAENLVGKDAVVRSMLNPEGHVFVEGALWRARAPDEAGRVVTGTVVRVVGLDDRLTLEVEVPPPAQGAAR